MVFKKHRAHACILILLPYFNEKSTLVAPGMLLASRFAPRPTFRIYENIKRTVSGNREMINVLVLIRMMLKFVTSECC